MTAKEVTSVRVDPDLKQKAEAAGLNLGSILNEALAKALKERTCPTCGQKLKRK